MKKSSADFIDYSYLLPRCGQQQLYSIFALHLNFPFSEQTGDKISESKYWCLTDTARVQEFSLLLEKCFHIHKEVSCVTFILPA